MARSQQDTLLKLDAASFLQEHAKVVAASAKYREELKQLKNETTKVTAEEKKLAREGKRVFDQTRTPLEQHNRKMEQLNRLVKKGAIDQQTYRRAVIRSKDQLQAAGRAGQQAFGARALGQLTSMALGYVSVSAGIGLIVRALRDEVEQRKELARLQAEAAPSAGALAQLTGGDPKKTAQLQAAGQAIFMAGGAKSQAEAFKVAFNLQSAGALKQRGFVSRLAAVAGEGGIVGMTGEAGKLQEAMGKAETGTFVDIFSKATGAAAPLPKVGVSQILQATTTAAGSAQAMGLSDEELFAAVSRVSGTFSPKEASTAVARMLDQLAVKRPELKGKGLINMMQTLEAQKMSEEDLKKLLQIRGLRAFRILKDVGGLRDTLQTVEQAQRDQAIMGVAKGGAESPLVFASRELQIQEAREDVARTRETMAQNLLDAQMASFRRKERAKGHRPVGLFFGDVGAYVGSFFRGPEVTGRAILNRWDDPSQSEWRAKWDKLDRAAESLERATENMNQTSRQRPVQQSN